MSENDDAVLTAAVGYVYTNAVGSAAPSAALLKTINLRDPSTWTGFTGWTSVGHTSRGTLPEFGFEGDGSEIKGSWQKKKLREISTEDPIDYVTVVLHQFDEKSLELYYGPNDSDVEGEFGVKIGQLNEKSVFVVIEDGDLRLGHHALKSSVKRDEAIELPIDDLAALPVRFTYLDYEDETSLFKWINEDLFNVDLTP
ncbi:phage tail protein [Mycobacterium sp. Root265]|uniref:phage tail tube protein n=1 Tax=Mycobacterium sp. Root265 TaxID=1736504 RepID=UPI00070FD24C|nr:hypothetical protein [Mycobacterium sp. Root265]KRD08569.1 phage tail protein [Mycobacterium sp. Root265]